WQLKGSFGHCKQYPSLGHPGVCGDFFRAAITMATIHVAAVTPAPHKTPPSNDAVRSSCSHFSAAVGSTGATLIFTPRASPSKLIAARERRTPPRCRFLRSVLISRLDAGSFLSLHHHRPVLHPLHLEGDPLYRVVIEMVLGDESVLEGPRTQKLHRIF